MDSKRLVLAVLPSLVVFLSIVFLKIFPLGYPSQTNVIEANDAITARLGGSFFLVDYLRVNVSIDHYPSYWSLLFSVGLLFAVLFLPYIYLIMKGFFRNKVLDLWTGLLLFGAFGCLVFPFCALEFWHRWMFMLVYPFTFYAIKGVSKLTDRLPKKKHHFMDKKEASMILLTFSIAIAYLAAPVWLGYAKPVTANNTSDPSVTDISFYFSASPTVPYEDVNSVVQAMSWLNENFDAASCVVLHHAFLFWGQLYLNKSYPIVHFEINSSVAVETALNHNFSKIYFVWWNEPIGWYGQSVPQSFFRLQDFGRISVYEYEGEPVVGS